MGACNNMQNVIDENSHYFASNSYITDIQVSINVAQAAVEE